MSSFTGKLAPHEGDRARVFGTVQVDAEGYVRIWADHRRLAASHRQDMVCERLSAFRFLLRIEGHSFSFTPDEPSMFSNAIGAVVDLRPKTRFGLKDRMERAGAELGLISEDSGVSISLA